MLERYRPTMTEDVVHSWAADSQNKLDKLMIVVAEFSEAMGTSYSMSPEGREFLKKMSDALNA